MCNVTILPNNNLMLTANNETRAYIKDQYNDGRGYYVLYDLLEYYACNGSFTPFDAGNADPFVGLTSAPCIAESMDVDDDGKHTIEGRFWYYANYMITDPMQELKNKGRVIFNLAT